MNENAKQALTAARNRSSDIDAAYRKRPGKTYRLKNHARRQSRKTLPNASRKMKRLNSLRLLNTEMAMSARKSWTRRYPTMSLPWSVLNSLLSERILTTTIVEENARITHRKAASMGRKPSIAMRIKVREKIRTHWITPPMIEANPT